MNHQPDFTTYYNATIPNGYLCSMVFAFSVICIIAFLFLRHRQPKK